MSSQAQSDVPNTLPPPEVPADSRAQFTPGSVFGDYRIRRLLGKGGMGSVYEAEQIVDGRRIALKILNVDLGQLEARDRFLREGRSAAAVNHPNTVYVYRAEEIDGIPAICMELVGGGTLEELVQSKGPLAIAKALDYTIQMIEGLAAAHDVGLLHRDVKPSNCFVDSDGTLKVGDFGLSKPSNADEQLRLTQTGVFLGTPVYSSPEQLLGETLDMRSDIYAVGVTLYYALTGVLPFPSGSMMQVIAAVVNGVPTPLATHRPDVPATVAAVVMKALARNRDDRFQSYDEFRDAVAALRNDDLVAATPRDRLRAWLVDGTIVTLLMLGLLAVMRPAGRSMDAIPKFLDAIAALVVMLLVAVPEGLRGATLGKWLFGVRVVGDTDGPPGLARAFGRAAVLWSAYLLSDALELVTGSSGVGLVVFVVARVATLMTAKRGNGWRTVQDLLTRTRVVQSAGTVLSRRRSSYRVSPPEGVGSDHAERVGPYVVAHDGTTPDGSVSAWDPALSRPVWVARHAGEGGLTEARRAIKRTTRLRWLGSDDASSVGWNSYSAPGGESFLRRIERPVAWQEVEGWIEDMTDELIAAESDGTLTAIPGVESLWVGGNGALLIADVKSIPAGAGAQARRSQDLVAELISGVRASGALPRGLPAFATAALDAAASAPTPDHARAAILETRGKPVAVTRRWRTWMFIAQFAPIVLLPVVMTAAEYVADSGDRDGAKLDRLISYVGLDPGTQTSGTDQAGRTFGRTIRGLRITRSDRPSAASRDSLVRNRRLARIYIASVMAKRAVDTTTASLSLSRSRQRRAAAIVRTSGTPTPDEVHDARFLVDTVWRGIPPGESVGQNTFGFATFMAGILGLIMAITSVLTALLFRRGPLLRLFGVELVSDAGYAAGRGRVCLRQIVIGIPSIVFSAVFLGAATGLSRGEVLPPLGWLLVVVLIGCWAGYLWHALRFPAQSLADRVARTYLVPM